MDAHPLEIDGEHQFHIVLTGIALNVELSSHQRPEVEHVGTGDVTLIGAGMHRDAVGTETLDVDSDGLYTGHIAATRIAQGCYLVDIDTKVRHIFLLKNAVV